MSAPKTLTELLPKGTNRRTPVLHWSPVENPTGYTIGTLVIENDRCSTTYRVDEFPCDDCRGFCFVKLTPGTDAQESCYCLSVGADGQPKCECKGWVRWSPHGGGCKHAESLRALLENGWL